MEMLPLCAKLASHPLAEISQLFPIRGYRKLGIGEQQIPKQRLPNCIPHF